MQHGWVITRTVYHVHGRSYLEISYLSYLLQFYTHTLSSRTTRSMGSTVIVVVVISLLLSISTAIAMREHNAYRLWMILKDVALTGLGMFCIWSQIRQMHPNGLVLGTGLALCVPTVWQHVKALLPGGTEGSSGEDGGKSDK